MLLTIILLAVIVFLLSIIFEAEISSAKERDPASRNSIEILLLYPGVHAIITHRISHFFWDRKIPFLPRFLSQLARLMTGIEIHPGAQIGKGLFIDHGMGVVVGETTIIGDNVTLFQGVTLGGTGKEHGKRHPTLEDNIVVGTGAKVLGNIRIGSNSYLGANAVVIKDVPANSTVVGVPGRLTKQDGKKIDGKLDHVHILDPVVQTLTQLEGRIKDLENQLKKKS